MWFVDSYKLGPVINDSLVGLDSLHKCCFVDEKKPKLHNFTNGALLGMSCEFLIVIDNG